VALYAALVSGVVGISIFALGASFNYLVSLFYKTPIRQGLFGRPLLKTPVENYFGWGGFIITLIGAVVAIVTLSLGLQGWEMTRLWLYLLGSAMMLLVGMQLLINSFLMRVLSELSKRADEAEQDFHPVL
jgi:hypothetical protein